MSAVLAGQRMQFRAWRLPLLTMSGALALLLSLYWETFSAMEGIWARSGTFAHAYLVPPIVLWLIWRQRDQLLSLRPRAQPWAILLMLILGLAWFVGELAGVNAITQLAATALLVLSVPAVLGWPVAKVLAFPLGFLFFMVPFGEFVMPTMMDWTADVTVFTLRLLGIPVYREGLQFVIPSGNWSVVEACSGIRYLIASFMVGTLFAYLNFNSTKRRLLFVFVSLVVPVVANWARAAMIVLLGHYSGNKLAVGVDHLIYGWVFFGVVIGIMFFIGSRWSQAPVTAARTPDRTASGGQEPWQWLAACATVLVLGAPPLLAAQFQAVAVKVPVLELPALVGAVGTNDVQPLHRPHFEGALAEASRVYGQGPSAVTVHVAFYRQQTYGRKLVNSQNVLATSDDKVWRRTNHGSVLLSVAGKPVGLRAAELRSGNLAGVQSARLLFVRQIYWVDGQLTTNDQLAALLGVFGQLMGRGDDAAALTFYMAGNEADASPRALDAFIAAQLPALTAWLDQVRADR